MGAGSKWLAAVASVAVVTVAALMALGCSGNGEEPVVAGEATATATVRAASTPAEVRATETPTATAEASPAQEPSATPESTPTATPTPAALTAEAVLNGEYVVADMNATVQFEAGVHYWVRDPGQADSMLPSERAENWVSRLDTELVGFGDLDGDGAADAAAIMRSQFGGSGVFVTLAAVRNEGGSPVHVATAPLGDRVAVNAVEIQDGEIVVDMLTHASPGSPQFAGQCCPNVPVEMRFHLQGTELVRLE